jgi:poly(U)-specific endoribonuclease
MWHSIGGIESKTVYNTLRLKMIIFLASAFCAISFVAALPAAEEPVKLATDEEIRTISSQIWAADSNRLTGSDVQYNVNGIHLFTYVNEAKLTGTYARMRALFDNYTPDTGVVETCGTTCRNEESAFLDAILATQPIQLLHQWLIGQGLASSTVAGFKTELNQYWFMPYTRSRGPLDSSGFEHTFVGEINNGAVSGFHNWVNTYFEEKSGDFVYGPYQRTCANEAIAFGFKWLGKTKTISSVFIRTSPEVEIALYTLCLLAKTGSACPLRLGSTQQTMTAWDMTGLPKTIGSAYPNC